MKSFIFATALFLASCACTKPDAQFNPGCKILNVVVTCAGAAASAGFVDLVAAVVPAVAGNQVNWSALADLEKTNGTDAVMCALQKALAMATTPTATGFGASLHYMAAQSMAVDHADNVKTNVNKIFAKRRVVFVGR